MFIFNLRKGLVEFSDEMKFYNFTEFLKNIFFILKHINLNRFHFQVEKYNIDKVCKVQQTISTCQ